MSVVLIGFEGHQRPRKQAEIIAQIEAFENWIKLSESSYAVQTTLRIGEVFLPFKRLLDEHDTFWVIPLRRPYVGQASKAQMQWLNTYLTY